MTVRAVPLNIPANAVPHYARGRSEDPAEELYSDPGSLRSDPDPYHRMNLTGYVAGGMIEYTAFRSARSRGSPVTDVPIPLVT
jgi:hypothetical protein